MIARIRRLRYPLSCIPLLLLVIVVSGCIGNSNPQDTLSPAGAAAADSKRLFYPAFWIAVAIFFLTEGALLLAVFRFRHRGAPSDRLPKQVHGNTRLEVAWTIAPALLLAILAVPTIATIFHLRPSNEGDPLNVTVIGHQWWWEFRYPDLGVVTANELHIPTHRRINLVLQSGDVIHIFYVPRLAGGMDNVPGHNNTMWIEANQEGVYQGQCTQFCGASHAFMRFKVFADSPQNFDAWVQHQKEGPVNPATLPDQGNQVTYTYNGKPGTPAGGLKVFANNACIGCHAITGVANGMVGPNLTHFGERTSLAGASLANTPDNVARWIHNPQEVKPEAKMPNLHLSDEEIANLVAYLESLK
jgi:cytochrome c oxidase subunit 2